MADNSDKDIVDKVVIGIDVQTGQDLEASLSRSDIAMNMIDAYVMKIIGQTNALRGGQTDQGFLQGLTTGFDRLSNLLSANKITQPAFDRARNFFSQNFGDKLQAANVGELEGLLKNGFLGNEMFLQYALPQASRSNLEGWKKRGIIDNATYLQNVIPMAGIEELRQFFQNGDIDRGTFLNYANAQIDSSGMTDWQKKLERAQNRWLPSNQEIAFRKSWDEAAKGVARFAASFYALQAPFRQFYRFIDGLKQANLQFSNLAQSANLTAGNLAAQSGLAAASGSSASAYANFRRSFELAMEQRNIGMGNGGAFTQALMRYGIQYDPNSFEATQRNIVAFMSDPTKSARQKQMAGQILGMDQGMIAAAMRGNDFYEKYTKETAGLAANSDAAAEASRALSLETQKLALAWQDFKNGLFVTVEPVVTFIVQVTTEVVKFLKLPVIRHIVGLTAAIYSSIKVWALFKIAMTTGKDAVAGFIAMMAKMAAMKTAQKGVEIGSAATSIGAQIATTAAGRQIAKKTAESAAGGIGDALGRTAQKAGGFARMGWVGAALAVVDVVSGVTNTIMGGVQRHNTNIRLDSIYNLLNTRIPLGLEAIFKENAKNNGGGGSGSKTVNISNLEVRVEYLGKSHEELVKTVKNELNNELKTLLD